MGHVCAIYGSVTGSSLTKHAHIVPTLLFSPIFLRRLIILPGGVGGGGGNCDGFNMATIYIRTRICISLFPDEITTFRTLPSFAYLNNS